MAVKHNFNSSDNVELIKRFRSIRDTVQEERKKRTEKRSPKKDLLTYRTGQASRLKK